MTATSAPRGTASSCVSKNRPARGRASKKSKNEALTPATTPSRVAFTLAECEPLLGEGGEAREGRRRLAEGRGTRCTTLSTASSARPRERRLEIDAMHRRRIAQIRRRTNISRSMARSIAALPPMPSPSVRVVARAKPGERRSERRRAAGRVQRLRGRRSRRPWGGACQVASFRYRSTPRHPRRLEPARVRRSCTGCARPRRTRRRRTCDGSHRRSRRDRCARRGRAGSATAGRARGSAFRPS